MVTFEELDKKTWYKFRANTKNTLSSGEFETICRLHAKYFNHRFYKPCTCNPKQIKRWIVDLNKIWDND